MTILGGIEVKVKLGNDPLRFSPVTMGSNSYFYNFNIWSKPFFFNQHGHLLSNLHLLYLQWEVCGQLACIVYDGNQVLVFVACEAIKLWIKTNGTFNSCIIPNICLQNVFPWKISYLKKISC